MSGGGESLDQGVHLIDLSLVPGEFIQVDGEIEEHLWDMPVRGQRILHLKTCSGQVDSFMSRGQNGKTFFRWKSTDVCGQVELSGLGESYGTERMSPL